MQRYIDELSLLHALRLALVATDTAGVITFVNEAATEAYAMDADGPGRVASSGTCCPSSRTRRRPSTSTRSWRGRPGAAT